MILQELCKTYNTSTWPYLKGSWSDLDRDNFQTEIEGMYGRIKTQITKLTQNSGELINLVTQNLTLMLTLGAKTFFRNLA